MMFVAKSNSIIGGFAPRHAGARGLNVVALEISDINAAPCDLSLVVVQVDRGAVVELAFYSIRSDTSVLEPNQETTLPSRIVGRTRVRNVR